MLHNYRKNVLILVAISFLITCYYYYYSYYINLFIPDEPLLISRVGLNNIINLDLTYDPISFGMATKVSNSAIYTLIFSLGYSALVYSLYSTLESIKKLWLVYFTIISFAFLVLIAALALNNHSFLYRAGAEIRNFVWSPVFMILILLGPKMSLKKMND